MSKNSERNHTNVRFVRNGLYTGNSWKFTSRLTPKEKPHQCKVGQKKCVDLTRLKVHIRTHTKVKPYQCEFCQKCFSQRSHWNSHIRTHTKEKSNQCGTCKKMFFTATSYEKPHQDSHKRESWETLSVRVLSEKFCTGLWPEGSH